MPLYRDFSDDQATILLWKYSEDEDFNLEFLLEKENFDKVKDYHPTKLKETLLVRKILKSVLPDYKILYDGRIPYLFPNDYEISVTHSFPFAALAISKNKVGIDIEPFNQKILRIQHKFLHEEESSFIEKEKEVAYLTVIWSLKESLYKIHHSNYWSLKKHYEVKPFSLDFPFDIQCRVHDDNVSDLYKARVEFFENYCFTIVD
ncbi:4'-phosphopantetheinyl transferase superfamily protein [Kaistella flava (ex Peng et al. 2021)]|uniref:4'-phosphopantetheinyl transferase superfamily protein n=1 Tax=Kaistella flava (ex Peng et al. 2021) TaxID=2038776 RepID=A0A7M2Y907_9FLAO|nr:4'-phosphopantetheinyl transferase superfamily protein [Kaistella flava (ex Peng et al. 2021)]QOW10319.1 4'-phosphopantetheinyl transferase superfamily protein [Kaistella flava (ex Peng et al. 2021)]